MLDLHLAFDLQRQHEERRRQLAYDYQKGNADYQALIAFINRKWQRLSKAVNAWRRGLGSFPRKPELHY